MRASFKGGRVAPWPIACASDTHNPEAPAIVKRQLAETRKFQNGRTITMITIPNISNVGASFHMR